MLSLATNGIGREVRIACRLKEAGEVIQLDKLAFCLAHPALHRKLNFALRLRHAGWIGGSIDVPLDQRGDIYIDAADSTATGVWLDPVKAQAVGAGAAEGAGDCDEGGVGPAPSTMSAPFLIECSLSRQRTRRDPLDLADIQPSASAV